MALPETAVNPNKVNAFRTAMQGLIDAVAALQTEVDGLSDIEAGDLQQAIDDLQSGLTAVEADVADHETRIAALETP